MEEVGQRIKSIRKQIGMSMEEFGKQFTPIASKGVVSNWENNYNLPNKKRLQRIAHLGNVSLKYLLTGETGLEDIASLSLKRLDELSSNPIIQNEIITFHNIIISNQSNEHFISSLNEVLHNMYKASNFNFLDWQISNKIPKEKQIEQIQDFFKNYETSVLALIEKQKQEILSQL